jgi:nucleotide-binding universal stress UspA family protein
MADTSPVVVGVDGSQAARAALRWAIDYARCVDAPVHAVAVLAQPLVAADGVTVPIPQPVWDPDLDSRFAAEAERWLAGALPAPYADEPTPPVSLTATPGDPCDVLCEHARTARLVVLGNPRQSALAAALTGSTAMRCLHHAECPVVLVPEAGVAEG